MEGLAELELVGGKDCKTVIKKLLVKPPLLIQKAMYLDQNNPGTAHIYIMSSACGILQDDKITINIKASENSNAFITTQSATKIYKTEQKRSNQVINIFVEKNSFLEFLPKQIIPHKLAEFYQKVNIKIDPSSTLIYSENISCGRIAYGEEFDFTSLIFRTNAVNEKEDILFSDAINIEPSKRKYVFKNLFGKKKIFSTTYIISKVLDNEKLDYKINLILKNNKMFGGVSQLPNNSGLIIRILSDSIDEIENNILEITDYIKKSYKIKIKN
ncbi:MAG: urease accessory protein UreD [Nitrosopumilaceae archaeon]